MKKALLALAAAAAASSSIAQGIITFYNNAIPINGRTITAPATAAAGATTYRAGIFRADGSGAGAGATAGLFFASDAGNPTATPLATTTFRLNNTFEVFAAPQDVVVPGVPVGSTANFIVRVWETAAGSYAAADRWARGESSSWTSDPLGGTVPGNPPAANATMSGFMGAYFLIPEPSSLAFAAIGISAMILRRRK
jgi:hypothetical protein